jgi:hypothetical protein
MEFFFPPYGILSFFNELLVLGLLGHMSSKHVQQHMNCVMAVMIQMEKENLMAINSVMGVMIPMEINCIVDIDSVMGVMIPMEKKM